MAKSEKEMLKEFVDEKLDKDVNVGIFDGSSVGVFTKKKEEKYEETMENENKEKNFEKKKEEKNEKSETTRKEEEESSDNIEREGFFEDEEEKNHSKRSTKTEVKKYENKEKVDEINSCSDGDMIKPNEDDKREVESNKNVSSSFFIKEKTVPKTKEGVLSSLLLDLNEHVNKANSDAVKSLLKEVLTQFAAEQALRHLEEISNLKIKIQNTFIHRYDCFENRINDEVFKSYVNRVEVVVDEVEKMKQKMV
jgi:hypothetical protein